MSYSYMYMNLFMNVLIPHLFCDMHILLFICLVQALIPMMTGKPANQKSVDQFQAGMETVLDHFNSHWLADRKFVAGSEISIADIFAVCELLQPGTT